MPYQHPDSVLQVFCKAPQPGQVKTRLMTELTAEQAAQVHIDLTERLLARLYDAALCPLQLWCSPNTDHAFFQHLALRYPISLHPQTDGGLGKRMADAIDTGLQQFKHVMLMGCDCPSLTIADLKHLLAALNNYADVVLAPTEDGGYSLIGVKQPQPLVLSDIDMPWGTPQVLARTRARLKQQRLVSYESALQWDVDTPEDWRRYQATYL